MNPGDHDCRKARRLPRPPAAHIRLCGTKQQMEFHNVKLSAAMTGRRVRRALRGMISTSAGRAAPVGLAVWMLALAACSPPTEVVDVQDVPPITKYTMARVPILPPGLPPLGEVGTIGPIEGFGCASTREDANREAVRQLQMKALQWNATAVTNVLMDPTSSLACTSAYGVIARGIAVAPD